MRGKRLVRRLVVMSVVAIFAASGVQAQTKAKTPVTPASTDAFDKLSLGNQKVASALYQAQSAPASTKRTTQAARPLTLEEIAAKRRSGQEWGQIFRELKAQGLVQEKSLGQVVARYQQTLDARPGLLASDSSGGRSNAHEAASNKGGK